MPPSPPDNVDRIADELYALAAEEFTAARDAQVKEARRGKDKSLAAALGGLRRPTVSAWLVNLLTRESAGEVAELLALGVRLQAAQASLDGNEMRALTAERHRLVATLRRAAAGLAAEHGRPMVAAVEQEVTATLEATLSDPAAAEAVRTGRLTSPLSYSGFGLGLPMEAAPARAAVAPRRAGASRRDAVADRARAGDRGTAGAADVPKEAAAERRRQVASARAAVAELSRQLDKARKAERQAQHTAADADRQVQALEQRLATARSAAAAATTAAEAARETMREAEGTLEAAQGRLARAEVAHKGNAPPRSESVLRRLR